MAEATRKLATIVAVDVAGYSARTEADSARCLDGLDAEGCQCTHGTTRPCRNIGGPREYVEKARDREAEEECAYEECVHPPKPKVNTPGAVEGERGQEGSLEKVPDWRPTSQ